MLEGEIWAPLVQRDARLGCRRMAGEELHEQGAEGARRAKLWLEATTRAIVHWVVPNVHAVRHLTFSWPAAEAEPFSFDLGGVLRGGEVDGLTFAGEVKNYAGPADQGTLFRDFVAKCYCAYAEQGPGFDRFLWITWSPFLSTRWSELRDADFVQEGVLANRAKALGDPAATAADVDRARCEAVADRIWIIVLCEAQEDHLSLSTEHMALIRGEMAREGAAGA